MSREKVDHIVTDNGVIMVENSILTCNRLYKYYRVLSVLINPKNIKTKYNKVSKNTHIILKRELRSVLNNCSEDNIDKNLRGLRNLGVVTDYSKKDGIDGTYTVTLAERLDQNPYVLLGTVEKKIIKSCHINKNVMGEDYIGELLDFIEIAAKSVEAEYVEKLKNAMVDALEEYETYLMTVITETGFGTFDRDANRETTKSYISKSNEKSDLESLYTLFCAKYETAKGLNHPVSKQTSLKQISKVLERCSGNNEKASQYIEVYFEFFSTKDPTSALLADDNILSDISDFIEKGINPTVYGKKPNQKGAQKQQDLQKAEQQYHGTSEDDFIKRMEQRRRNNDGK